MITETISKIESVPFVFRMPERHLYPEDNFPDFEYWFYLNVKSEDIIGERIYLPILFTAFYKTCDYGNNKTILNILQNFLNTLDRKKKYFVICQWDDSIINDISHLDIKVFSMAGGRKDYGLPLICKPHQISFNVSRDIFASFVGRITHPIRTEIIKSCKGKNGFYVSVSSHKIPSYCSVMARSVFTLCPRGYSQNSFRIMEAIEMGSIPVWISESFLPIHDLDFNTFGVTIKSEDVGRIEEILRSFSDEEIKAKQAMLPDVFDKYFSFPANKKLILANI